MLTRHAMGIRKPWMDTAMARKAFRLTGLALLIIAGVLLVAHLVFRPPSLEGRPVSQGIQASDRTALGRFALTVPDGAAGQTAVVPLLSGTDAFTARIATIRAAEVALDVQYYIWQSDTAGLILLDELRAAAERGVRVRLLLDDNGITGLDGHLAALDAMEAVEVRLFNPFILRTPKWLGYAFDFFRLNRRMHNKSLTADGAVSILGGRNIGDLYFGLGEGMQYIDTDVMVAGQAAFDVTADFDRYWASRSAHLADRILPDPAEDALSHLSAEAQRLSLTAEGQRYGDRLREANIVRQIGDGQVSVEWTDVTLVSDDPAKGLGRAHNSDLLFPQLMELLALPSRSVDLISAYFVPGRQFTQALSDLEARGVRVRILTNSQDATDVILVHSAYIKYRPELLRSGVELYELKPSLASDAEAEDATGSSRASLHSKTLLIDGKQMFVGSFNFDPRSLMLNTEMGVLIDSATLAGTFEDRLDAVLPVAAFRPVLERDGRIAWQSATKAGETVLLSSEPGTTVMSRLVLRLLGLLPIEWLL